MDNKLIELKNISFSYDSDRVVLNDLNLDICKGDRIAIKGSNGIGKTTLLQIIIGLIKCDSGSIFAYGKKREVEKDFFEVRAKTGFLFQDPDDQLFCATVAEDVAFGPLNLGKKREEVAIIVKETLSDLGIEKFEHRVTYKLSSGEKRLVALATVLAMKPEVMLLDEPTAGLDSDVVERLIKVLRSLNKTLVIISHDQEFLDRVTDKKLILKNGTILNG